MACLALPRPCLHGAVLLLLSELRCSPVPARTDSTGPTGTARSTACARTRSCGFYPWPGRLTDTRLRKRARLRSQKESQRVARAPASSRSRLQRMNTAPPPPDRSQSPRNGPLASTPRAAQAIPSLGVRPIAGHIDLARKRACSIVHQGTSFRDAGQPRRLGSERPKLKEGGREISGAAATLPCRGACRRAASPCWVAICEQSGRHASRSR